MNPIVVDVVDSMRDFVFDFDLGWHLVSRLLQPTKEMIVKVKGGIEARILLNMFGHDAFMTNSEGRRQVVVTASKRQVQGEIRGGQTQVPIEIGDVLIKIGSNDLSHFTCFRDVQAYFLSEDNLELTFEGDV